MYMNLSVMYWLFLSDLNETWIFSTDSSPPPPKKKKKKKNQKEN